MSGEDVYHCLDDGLTSLSFDTIYLGSEFCWDKLDAGQNWGRLIGLCKKNGCKVFFVFPILPERYVKVFRELLVLLAKAGVDGVVVNDYGTLYYIYQQMPSFPVVVGRLLIKTTRDYIQPQFGINPFRFPKEIIKISHDFNCIRLDMDYCQFSKEGRNDIDIEIGIHSISYLTSSMCCDYKFDKTNTLAKNNSICKRNCLNEAVVVPNSPLIKLGNALLYNQSIDDNFITDTIILDYKCCQFRTCVL